MEAYGEVDEINMEAWPENNSHRKGENGENEKITHNTKFNDGEKLCALMIHGA